MGRNASFVRSAIRRAKVAAQQKFWRGTIRYWQFVLDAYGEKLPAGVRSQLRKAERTYNRAEILHRNNLVFRAVADPEKIIWIRPGDVKFKLMGTQTLKLGRNDILAGDWDLDRREIETTAKYKSIIQHFRDGIDWEETDLFQRYARRLDNGMKARGRNSIADVKEDYEETINQLYQEIREKGFLLPKDRNKKSNDLPPLHIGRDGELLFGRDGNHRLAMARLLDLKVIPCVVHTRHTHWQEVREKIFQFGASAIQEMPDPKLAEHPDLADLIDPA
jgi:hypothetical protein